MNSLQIKKILRSTPANMRRLVYALCLDGFDVVRVGNWDRPVITITTSRLHDGENLYKALVKHGKNSENGHINFRSYMRPDGTYRGELHLLDYADDDFTALPPLDIDCSFTLAQIEAAARAAHGVNRSYCEAGGDTSQKSWEEAPNWQRQSALEGVRAVIDGKTPDQLHESWVQAKVADGWRYGEVKDAEAKTHPCIVQYAELSEFQQRKDEIFRSTVCAVLGIELTGDNAQKNPSPSKVGSDSWLYERYLTAFTEIPHFKGDQRGAVRRATLLAYRDRDSGNTAALSFENFVTEYKKLTTDRAHKMGVSEEEAAASFEW